MNTSKSILLIATIAVLSISLSACSSKQKRHTNTGQNSGALSSQQGTYGNGSTGGGFQDSPQMGDGSGSVYGGKNVFYFGFDQDTLTAQARKDLDAQAQNLRGGSTTIRLEGYADERGSRQYNEALGERRAQTVARYLGGQGISASRFEIISYGEEKPAATGSSARSHALNRRVELK